MSSIFEESDGQLQPTSATQSTSISNGACPRIMAAPLVPRA